MASLESILNEPTELKDLVEVLRDREGPQIKDKIGVLLQLDAAMDENHEISAEISRHPVEEGADIADHIRVNPPKLTINGIVTATPLDEPFDNDRERDAWDVIEYILNAREPVTVRTGLKTYTDMVLTSASITRDSKRRIAPPLVFEHIRRVAPAWAVLPAEAAKKRPAAKPKADKGTQAAKEAEAEQRRSLLIKAGQATGLIS